MPIFFENLRHVVIPLIQRVQSEYASVTGTRTNTSGMNGDVLRDIDKGISGLLSASAIAEAAQPATGITVAGRVDQGWMALILNELSLFNGQGIDAIQSCSEALLKCHGLINAWHTDPRQRSRVFYRGEVDYGWTLVSRLARRGYKHNPKNQFSVTQGELDVLAMFQERVKVDLDLRNLIFGENQPVNDDAPEWWELAQHYDSENGTRMLDLTSSIFAALYFACSNWDGTIDETKDGSLYLIPHKPGRGESFTPDIIRGRNVGWADQAMETASSYFTVDSHEDVARFRHARGRNDRVIAQDGFFMWQPKFELPMQAAKGFPQHFKFRVFRKAKQPILRELYSIGYTARRIVGGPKGEEAHLSLCKILDLDPDD